MAIWKKRWLNLALVCTLVIAFAAGCAPQQRPDDDTAPDPTRAPGINDMGPNDNRNNLGLDNDRDGNAGILGRNGNNAGMLDRDGNDVGDRAEGNMRLADDIANRLTNMREIDAATVMLSDNNAFVAVDMPGRQQGRVTNDLKNRISDEVRHLDRDIDNVYVSADPDFFNRMGGYARDIRNGEPIQGLADQVTETIRRVFPTAQ